MKVKGFVFRQFGGGVGDKYVIGFNEGDHPNYSDKQMKVWFDLPLEDIIRAHPCLLDHRVCEVEMEIGVGKSLVIETR